MPPRAYVQQDPPATLEPYFPTTTFKTVTPAEAGMDAAKLTAALQFAPQHTRTQGIAVFRNGHIVGERYVAPFTQETRHESYSVAKGFSSALVGIAIRDKLIPGVDTPICGYYPEWGCDPSNARSRITIEHAMNVETGLRWSEDWRLGASGPNDAMSLTILDTALSRPVVDDPGTKKRYSTGDPALLTGVLQKAAGKTAFEYAKTVLLGPIGLTGVSWGSDSKGRTTTHMGISATVREFAKFGILYLNRGNWAGKQVVPADWVDFTAQAADPCKEQYRYLWHINPPLRLGDADPGCTGFLQCDPTAFADLPVSGYFALGVYGQMIAVLPSAGIVVARVGQDDAGSEYWDGYVKDLIRLVLDAVN
jgi:CubicO group peptidase (beta-lactamase class C family)